MNVGVVLADEVAELVHAIGGEQVRADTRPLVFLIPRPFRNSPATGGTITGGLPGRSDRATNERVKPPTKPKPASKHATEPKISMPVVGGVDGRRETRDFDPQYVAKPGRTTERKVSTRSL